MGNHQRKQKAVVRSGREIKTKIKNNINTPPGERDYCFIKILVRIETITIVSNHFLVREVHVLECY